jgi:hypothetical protein
MIIMDFIIFNPLFFKAFIKLTYQPYFELTNPKSIVILIMRYLVFILALLFSPLSYAEICKHIVDGDNLGRAVILYK